MNNVVIAIDGPAGAGKSTVARLVARKLNYTYIDTGAMYRAATWQVLQMNLPTFEIVDIENAVEDLTITLKYENGDMKVMVGENDVTTAIRTPEVTALVSKVAQVSKVRHKLVALQQTMAERGAVVMDGRDICTHVLPNADVKVFLTASIQERAQRRYKELCRKGYDVSLKQLQIDIAARDKADSERPISPLIQAPDAILLDTTDLTIEEAVEAIFKMAERAKQC